MNNDLLLSELVAERTFTYNLDSTEYKMTVQIGKPRISELDGGDWVCPYQIGDKVRASYGIDSLQSLLLAFQMITAELEHIKLKQKIDLKWLEMDDLGI